MNLALRITVVSQIHLRCQQIMNMASPNDFLGIFSRLIIYISVLSTSQMEKIYGIQFPFPDLGSN